MKFTQVDIRRRAVKCLFLDTQEFYPESIPVRPYNLTFNLCGFGLF